VALFTDTKKRAAGGFARRLVTLLLYHLRPPLVYVGDALPIRNKRSYPAFVPVSITPTAPLSFIEADRPYLGKE